MASKVNGKWSYKEVTGTSYTQTKVAPGTQVAYKVQAYKVANGKKYYGVASAEVKTATRPAATTIKVAAKNKTSIKLSWKAIKNVSGYELGQFKNGKWVVVKNLPAKTNTYTVKGLTSGTSYKFRVRGYVTVNGKKVYGDYSKNLTVMTDLAAPTVKTVRTSKQVGMTWKAVTGADGYEVFKYNTSTKKYQKVKTVAKRSTLQYTPNKVSKKNPPKYKVRAYKNVGSKKVYSAFSATAKLK